MLNDDLLDKVRHNAEPLAAQMELVIFELNIRRKRTEIAVQILVDKKFGGIGLDECSRFNKALDRIFEDEQTFSEPYTLEVSSPGLDRFLKTPQDFFTVMNREVQFFLSKPTEGKLEYTGRVCDVQPEIVTIQVGKSQMSIPLNTINKARQVI